LLSQGSCIRLMVRREGRDAQHPRLNLNNLGRVRRAPKEHRQVGSNVRLGVR
jgi:translation initiation factor IF-3